MMKLSDLTWIGEKRGTVPGGVYRDDDGAMWIVKFPGDKQARNEVLAARLYRMAGVRVPRLELVELGKGSLVGVASRVETLTRPERLDGRLVGLLDFFLVDCWLANWDVIGLEYDNVMADGDQAVRVDLGGAILFRAQGKPKGDAFAGEVGEIVTMRMADVNRQAANVFGEVGWPNLEAGARALAVMDDVAIRLEVASVGLPTSVADTLVARRHAIVDEYEFRFTTH